jgi:hypothetical protein
MSRRGIRFPIVGKEVTYFAVGGDDQLMFVPIVAGLPLTNSGVMLIN